MDKKIFNDPVRKLGAITIKNIKRLLSSKISASLIIFGPLIMISVIGLAFQSQGFFGVNISVYSSQYNEVSEEIIRVMERTDFNVRRTLNKDSCESDVRNARSHLCIYFPEDFTTSRIEFHIDYSRINLVYLILTRLSDQIGEISENISLSATQDLLDFILEASNELAESIDSLEGVKENAELLQEHLENLTHSLEELDITLPGTLYELADNQSNISQSITNAKSDLELLKQAIIRVEEETSTLTEELSANIESIEDGISELQCTAQELQDLTQQFEAGNFDEALANANNPACAILHTFKVNLEARKQRTEELTSEMNETARHIETISGNIEGLENILKADAEQATQRITGLNETRQGLTEELQLITSNTSENIIGIEETLEKARSMISEFEEISMTDARTVIKPITTTIRPLDTITETRNRLDFLLPSILIMVVMFVSLLIGNVLVMKEKTSRAYFRSLILPVTNDILIAGSYITTTLITLIQSIIVLLIATTVFSAAINLSMASLLIVIIGSIIIFASMGMIIAYISPSEEISVLSAILLSVTMLMFSNIVMPIETMSEAIGSIAKLTPFNISEVLLRRIMVHGTTITGFETSLLALFAIQITILVASVYYAHNYSFKKQR